MIFIFILTKPFSVHKIENGFHLLEEGRMKWL